MPPSGSSSRTAFTAGRLALGFLATLLVWSVVVGDWRPPAPPPSSYDASSSSSTPLAPSSWHGWDHIEDLIVFGDSLSSTRFDYEGERPSWENPFGNQEAVGALPYGEGPKWINFLHDTYNASFFRVTNFAQAGATVERHYWAPRPQGMPAAVEKNTLKEEIGLFKGSRTAANRKPYTDWSRNSTLFALWFGVNEVRDSLDKGARLPLDPIFATYHASIERLYALGARAFLLLNTPPIDAVLPPSRAPDSQADPRADIADMNARLERMLSRLHRRHPDATFFHFDVHALWTRALLRPETFPLTAGLRDVAAPCAGYALGAADLRAHAPDCAFARDEYFWGDEHRPSHVVQQFTAQAVVQGCFADGGPEAFCSSPE